MNCRDIEPLLLAERDGVLTSGQHTTLDRHVGVCPACQQLRVRLAEALDSIRGDAAKVTLPDIDEEWRLLQTKLHEAESKPSRKRRLAPIVWFGSSLAAAAAVALAFFSQQPKPPTPELFSPDNAVVAEAEFVEAGDVNASTMVYVDKESGWLVVWATEIDANGKG